MHGVEFAGDDDDCDPDDDFSAVSVVSVLPEKNREHRDKKSGRRGQKLASRRSRRIASGYLKEDKAKEKAVLEEREIKTEVCEEDVNTSGVVAAEEWEYMEGPLDWKNVDLKVEKGVPEMKMEKETAMGAEKEANEEEVEEDKEVNEEKRKRNRE
jgi:hypothetical protein